MLVRRVRFMMAIAAVAAVAGLSACTPGLVRRTSTHGGAAHTPSAAATSTPSLPGAYLGGMAGPWYGPRIRPQILDLGADWDIVSLRWTRWTRGEAYGHGRYIESAGAGCPCTRYWAAVTLTDVRTHDGRPYFATMEVTGRHRKTLWLAMNTRLGWWWWRAK
jgi:hypothetical protein